MSEPDETRLPVELSVRVHTNRVELRCGQCAEPMMFGGIVLTSNPPQYPHRCVNGHSFTAMAQYPYLSYEEEA